MRPRRYKKAQCMRINATRRMLPTSASCIPSQFNATVPFAGMIIHNSHTRVGSVLIECLRHESVGQPPYPAAFACINRRWCSEKYVKHECWNHLMTNHHRMIHTRLCSLLLIESCFRFENHNQLSTLFAFVTAFHQFDYYFTSAFCYE